MTNPNPGNREESSPDSNSPEDIALISFLQANTAPVSPPSSSLEEQVMAAIAQQSSSSQSQGRHWRRFAVVGAGIAVIGVGVIQMQQWMTSPEYSTAKLEELDAYLSSSFSVSNAEKPLTEFDWGTQAQAGKFYPLSQTQAVVNPE